MPDFRARLHFIARLRSIIEENLSDGDGDAHARPTVQQRECGSGYLDVSQPMRDIIIRSTS